MTVRRFGLPFLLGLLAAVVLLAVAGVYFYLHAAYPMEYRTLVERYSAETGLEPALVLGVIHTESRFRPNAVSSVGARGLMQITEETFEWAKWRMKDEDTVYEDLFDPETNIRYGTFILSLLLKEFGRDDEALAAYHAGWGSVKDWLSRPECSADGVTLDSIPFKDTAKYVPRVLKTAQIYQKLYQYN